MHTQIPRDLVKLQVAAGGAWASAFLPDSQGMLLLQVSDPHFK